MELHTDEPAVDVVIGGHIKQGCPEKLYEPAGQSVQPNAPGPEYFPEAHVEQVVEATTSAYVPL